MNIHTNTTPRRTWANRGRHAELVRLDLGIALLWLARLSGHDDYPRYVLGRTQKVMVALCEGFLYQRHDPPGKLISIVRPATERSH